MKETETPASVPEQPEGDGKDSLAPYRSRPGGERTPEAVLRAMLRAYEAAALEADIAYFRSGDGTHEEASLLARSERADGMLADLRDATASAVVGGDYERILRTWGFIDDYEARLAGTRPLNAPPLEE